MKPYVHLPLLSVALLLGLAPVRADVIQIWTCQLSDDGTEQAVKTANDRWLEFANAALGEDVISSSAAYPVVGDTDEVVFVDRFPSLAAWSKVEDALRSDEGQAIGAALDAVVPCQKSALYRAVDSE